MVFVLGVGALPAKGQTGADFNDVPHGHPAETAIGWAVENGITVGVGGGRFGVGQTLTRYQMVTFLCRAFVSEECDSAWTGSETFADVPAGHWADSAIGWAVRDRITTGVSQTEFGGAQTLTREQAVTFLFRAKGSPGGGSKGSQLYVDVPADGLHWADQPIGWAYDQGITGMTSSGATVFGLGTALVREEMVVFLCQALAPDLCSPRAVSEDARGAYRTTGSGLANLDIRPEGGVGFDREEWGPHGSGLCENAAESSDPYTSTTIDTCNVDHVVALSEAHESGGWNWPSDRKREFSRDLSNHVASRACVNQSKGGDDINEWSDARIQSSAACGGGYRVTAAGRCFLARVTVAVKSKWGLSVDQAEFTVLADVLTDCGDENAVFTIGSDDPVASSEEEDKPPEPVACVISSNSAAEYDAVPGIGETLSARLWAAQPFTSIADLEAVEGIGPVKANAVWSHFCP